MAEPASSTDKQSKTSASSAKNYITPQGLQALEQEFYQLVKVERPEVVRVVSWAASNGDRSENGDYIYGKKRLRQIDARIRHLSKRIEAAEVVDPQRQQGLQKVYFGAWVMVYALAHDTEHCYRIVGQDELDPSKGYISWISPLAKALLGKQVGDICLVHTPNGEESYEISNLCYGETPDFG